MNATTLCILVADDHPLFRGALEQVLRHCYPAAELHQAANVNELTFLKRWRREVAGKLRKGLPRPEGAIADDEPAEEEDPIERLRTRLASAIEEERYEEAAQLRDEIDRLENPPAAPTLPLAVQIEVEAHNAWRRANPEAAGAEAWDAEAEYLEGAEVLHDGKIYVALPDVTVGIAPDDVFDADNNTGGWMPL